MTVSLSANKPDTRKLSDLSYDELVLELEMCHEMFRRCLTLLNGGNAEPVELFSCEELGDGDDLELYYKCLAIHDTREELN